jgi:hypothetical protein
VCWYSFRYGDMSPIDLLLPANAQPYTCKTTNN